MQHMSDAWNPVQYDKFKAERAQPFFDLAEMLQTVESPRLIDLGCGTGALTAELHGALKNASTVGLDSSPQMLEKAKGDARLNFIKGDVETWSPREEFDIVFSNAALQWCSGHTRLFARLRNALKPGGQLAVQMPMNFDYPTHTLALAMSREEPWAGLLRGQTYEKHSHMLTPEEYASLLFHLGFREQKVLLRVYGHVLESTADVVEWVKGTMLTHFESRLEPTDFTRFLAAYKERLLQVLGDEKPFFYPFKRILIWGRLP